MGYSVLVGDCIEQMLTLPDASVNTCVTSPPYWGLRHYGHEEQLGMEDTPDEYVTNMVRVFAEVRRVLRDDGTLWLNLGDTYSSGGRVTKGIADLRDAASGKQDYLNGTAVRAATPPGMKPKDLVGIPWMVAFALRTDGWYLRSNIVWDKPNPMPESVTDRPTCSHEFIFLLSKSPKYYYDHEAIKEPSTYNDSMGQNGGGIPRAAAMKELPAGQANIRKARDKQRGHSRKHAGFNDRWDIMTKEEQGAMGRNKRSVWRVATKPYPGSHFATYPPKLIEPCVLAGCPVGGTVLDPFGGSGTTAQVAVQNGRNAILCELNPEYVPLIHKRMSGLQIKMTDLAFW